MHNVNEPLHCISEKYDMIVQLTCINGYHIPQGPVLLKIDPWKIHVS